MTAPRRCDVLVVGGGPAGSVAATRLADRGLDVVLCERERFPRFHVGESLLPYSVPILRELGAWERIAEHGFQRKLGGTFLFEPDGAELVIDFTQNLPPHLHQSLHVRRADFDLILLRHAEEKGVEVREETAVRELLFEGGRAVGARVETGGREETVAARFVVDASGRDTLVGRQLRTRRRDPDLRQASLYAHFEGATMGIGRDGGNILVVGAPLGWYWLIPLDRNTTSVGFVFPPAVMGLRGGETLEDFFDRLLGESPEVAGRLEGAKRVTPVYPAADFSYRLDRFAGDGWVAVGDAAAFLDPVFSSGVHVAIDTGFTAADCLADAFERSPAPSREDFIAYERFFRRGLGRLTRYIMGYYDPGVIKLVSQVPPLDGFRRTISAILAGRFFRWGPGTWTADKIFHGLAGVERALIARGLRTPVSVPAERGFALGEAGSDEGTELLRRAAS